MEDENYTKRELDYQLNSLHKKVDEILIQVKLTNGRVDKNEKEIVRVESVFKYNRLIWYILTTAITTIGVLLTKYVI